RAPGRPSASGRRGYRMFKLLPAFPGGAPPTKRVPALSFFRAAVTDDVEFDSINDGVATDCSRVGGTFAERVAIRFPRSAHVITADCIERDQVDRVDLN